jgi:LPXTG-motif cell wall-anchored protein
MGKQTPAKGRSGKLRFVRTGSTLAYLAAEGKSESFVEIDQFEIGDEDVNMVRIAADNGGSPTQVDVRITSVRVVADELGTPTPLAPSSSPWLLWLGAGVVLAAVGGYGFLRRRR